VPVSENVKTGFLALVRYSPTHSLIRVVVAGTPQPVTALLGGKC
jgi:hypothetical protein